MRTVRLLRANEVVEMGVNKWTLQRLTTAREIPHLQYKPRGVVYYLADEIERWLEGEETEEVFTAHGGRRIKIKGD